MIGDMAEIPNDRFKYFALGFFSPKLDKYKLDENSMLGSTNPWYVFTGVLLACERGNFSALNRLIPLMKSNDNYLLWQASCNLTGHAGGWAFVRQLIQSFETRMHQPGVMYFMAMAMGSACSLNAIPHLKTMHSMAKDDDDRRQIEAGLSCTLESDDGPLMFGVEIEETLVGSDDDITVETHLDRISYFKLIDQFEEDVLGRLSDPNAAVFEGAPYDTIAVARRLRAHLVQGKKSGERVYRERLSFEASTGVDCTPFYNEARHFVPLAAIGVLDEFLESDAVGKFAPGQRYFFGHPIPL
jgi:hypothetical protein